MYPRLRGLGPIGSVRGEGISPADALPTTKPLATRAGEGAAEAKRRRSARPRRAGPGRASAAGHCRSIRCRRIFVGNEHSKPPGMRTVGQGRSERGYLAIGRHVNVWSLDVDPNAVGQQEVEVDPVSQLSENGLDPHSEQAQRPFAMKNAYGGPPRLEGRPRANLEATHLVAVVTDEDEGSLARHRLSVIGDQRDQD